MADRMLGQVPRTAWASSDHIDAERLVWTLGITGIHCDQKLEMLLYVYLKFSSLWDASDIVILSYWPGPVNSKHNGFLLFMLHVILFVRTHICVNVMHILLNRQQNWHILKLFYNLASSFFFSLKILFQKHNCNT